MIDRQKDEQYHEMLNNGEMYDSVDDEFIAYQHEQVQRLNDFNRTDETPEGLKERDEILKEICGTYGEDLYVIPPVSANCGLRHVHFGKRVVVNFSCCFVDDGDIYIGDDTMNGGSLTNKKGHLFHVTNTNAILTLNGVKLMNDDPTKVLLSVCADGWQGAGNKAIVSTSHQQLEGTILVGSDSELTLILSDGSTFNGCINGNITNAEGNCISNETGTVNVTMGDDCTWTLTADTYITSLKGETSRIKSNGHRLFVNGKQIKVD